MGTHAIIKIEGFSPVLYKHYDGYPESTLEWVTDFHKEFIVKRGWDKEYEFAQLIRSSSFDAERYSLDTSKQTGWGVYTSSHGIYWEFKYTLLKNGSVTVEEN